MSGRRGQEWDVVPEAEGLSLHGSASHPATRHDSLRDDMFWLLTSFDGRAVCDVVVSAPGSAAGFAAHKPVLAERCAAIAQKLSRGLPRMEGPDGLLRDNLQLPVAVSDTAVQCFLCFVYCGRLGRRQLRDEDLEDLRSLARLLDMPRLLYTCDGLRPCTLWEAQQDVAADEERVSFYHRMRADSVASRGSGGSSPCDLSSLGSTATSPQSTPSEPTPFYGTTPPNLSALCSDSALASPPLMVAGPPPPDTWAADMQRLGKQTAGSFGDGALCLLSCEGAEVCVSTAMLIARSDFHQRIFDGQWSPELCSDGVRRCSIDSNSIDPQALCDLVRFLCGDNLSFVPRSDFERVYRLAEVAEYWMVDHLFQKCQGWLSKFASPETVAPLWNVAEELRAAATCDVCRSVLVGRFAECAEARDFVLIRKQHLKAALDSGRINCPTHIVLRAIERWAKFQITQDLDGGEGVSVPQEAIHEYVMDLMPPQTMFNSEVKSTLLGLARKRPDLPALTSPPNTA